MVGYAVYVNSMWVALCAALVLLMHFGLAFFYGGLVSERNALNTIKMSIITLGLVPILWWAIGYSMVFSGTGLFFGDAKLVFLKHVGLGSMQDGSAVLDVAVVCFQAMFASIAPAIISGSGVERLKFNTYLVFIILWEILVYFPIAHAVWNPDGWAAKVGSFDFAGGIVVHLSAGISGLALAMVLKPRQKSKTEDRDKHNLPLMVLGCGLLWLGWFGFNGGSSLDVSKISLLAVANTLFATSAAMVMWVLCDIVSGRTKTVTGVCSSAIIGLVAITPAAGYVEIASGVAIGAISSVLTYIALIYYNKLKHRVDDSLDVFGCHGIPGFLGSLMVGIFASHNMNPAIPSGAIYGNWSLFFIQLMVSVCAAAFAFVATYILLLILDKTMGLQVDAEGELTGMDQLEHGERAYR